MKARTLLSAVLFLLLLALALVMRGGPISGDEVLERMLGGHEGAALSLMSRLVGLPVWTALVLAVGALLWLRGSRRAGLILVLADLSAEVAAFALKALVGRPRPDRGPTHDLVATGSFPSGHVVRATVTVGLLLALLAWDHPRLRTPFILVSVAFLLVVGAARVASGEHWPSDVLGGYLLGGAWADLALLAEEWWRRRQERLSEDVVS